MAKNSAISWTTHTCNFWIGCTKVSPACDECYAESLSIRWYKVPWGPGQPRRITKDPWLAPYRWAKACRAAGIRASVFSNSLSDFFDKEVAQDIRDRAWGVIRDTPELDWLLLTKRPTLIGRMLPPDWPNGFSHVHLGTSIVLPSEVDRNARALLKVEGGGIRWVSAEPLLRDISAKLRPYLSPPQGGGIGWVIVGGESGRKPRPLHPDWGRNMLAACTDTGALFHFKQWGELAPMLASTARTLVAMQQDGTMVTPGEGDDSAWLFERQGVERAGRLLDGVLYDAIPDWERIAG